MPVTYEVLAENGEAPHVYIAMPVTGGIPAPVVSALWRGQTALKQAGWRVSFSILDGNPHVDDARNWMVAQFLMTDASRMVFIDSDVSFEPDMLVRLLSHDVDLVGGVYTYKNDDGGFPVRLVEPITFGKRGLMPAEALPTGFLSMSRSLLVQLRDMAAHYTRRDTNNKVPRIFYRRIKGENRIGGDFGMCFDWTHLGGAAYLDPYIQLTHHGMKGWTANPAVEIAGAYAEDTPVFKVCVKALEDAIRDGKPVDLSVFKAMRDQYQGSWAPSPTFLSELFKRARREKICITEAGCGLTTLVAAIAVTKNGGRLTAFEHEPKYMVSTVKMLRRYVGNVNTLTSKVTVQYAPLEHPIHGSGWYQISTVEGSDLIVVDGPPRRISDRTAVLDRYVPRKAVLLVDDAEHEPSSFCDWAESNNREWNIIEAEKPFLIIDGER